MNTETKKMIPLAEADEAQLRAFAQDYLGMTFPGNTKADTMRAKIMPAWNKSEIPVEVPSDAAVDQQEGSPPPAPNGQQHDPTKVRIIVQRTEDAGGDEPVPVGVNGRLMLIPRGEEVSVPYPYFEVLQNAVKHIYDPLPEGGISNTPRKVPAYPFQRVA